MTLPRSQRLNLYLRTLAYFRPDIRRIQLLLLIIACSTVVGLLQVWPMAILIDSVIAPQPKSSWLGTWLLAPAGESVPAKIAWIAGAIIVLRLAQELTTVLQSTVNLRIANRGLLRVRCDLFQKLQSLNLLYHRGQPQGDVIYRLTSDTTGCQSILNVMIEVGMAVFTLLVMLVILLNCNVPLTLVALAVVPLLIATNLWFAARFEAVTRTARDVESEFTSFVQRSIASVGLMQAFCREPSEYLRFRDAAEGTDLAWFRFHWEMNWYRLCAGTIFAIGGAIILGFGGYFVYRDQVLSPRPGGMSVGDLVVFVTYLGMFYDPLCKISGAGASMQSGMAGMRRVFDILDRDPVVTDAPGAVSLPTRPRTLVLEDVSFAYHHDTPVLRDVRATIKPGEMVAFVGSSGVGKSTLLNLLPRFFDPTSGSVTLDGVDVRDVKLRDLRRHVSVVWQDNLMLPTTIAENIAYGRPGATRAEIKRASEMAGAAEFVEAFPGRYDTMVAEGGQNLSGGQRQRIAIARALLTGAPLIMLDEPTSALDSHHEHHITETLRALKGRRTIILVTHRLSSVIDCDQIFVMQEGRVIERGTHKSLLAQRGWYHQTVKRQTRHNGAAPEAA